MLGMRVFIVTNFLFCGFGLCIAIMGGYIHGTYSLYTPIVGNAMSNTAIFSIFVGIALVLLSVFACFGAVRESTRFIVIYGVFLVVIIAAELAVGIAAYVMKPEVGVHIEQNIRTDMQQYLNKSNIINTIQEKFFCCGTTGAISWRDSAWEKRVETDTVPDSCCKDPVERCGIGAMENATLIYQEGCIEAVRSWASNSIGIFIGVVTLFAIIEVIGCILTYCVARMLQKKY